MLAATFTACLFAAFAGPAAAADSVPPEAAPAATFQVEVIGAVLHSGKVELKDGDRVSLAIARAGTNISLNPDLGRVCIAHMGTSVTKAAVTEISAISVHCINMFKALQGGDMSSDPVLHPGDIVVVMARSQKAPVQDPT